MVRVVAVCIVLLDPYSFCHGSLFDSSLSVAGRLLIAVTICGVGVVGVYCSALWGAIDEYSMGVRFARLYSSVGYDDELAYILYSLMCVNVIYYSCFLLSNVCHEGNFALRRCSLYLT
jgi:hypothetical protein